MNIIICGAGRVGFTIAKQLSEQGHSITVIAQSSEDIQKIDESLDVKAIVGKATYPSILEKANARASQIVNDATSKAETEAEKILTSASKTIENDVNKAKEELRHKMSELIVETSEKILGEEITPDKHQELLAKAASEL